MNLEESLEECRGRARVLEQDLTESVSVEQHERVVREHELTAMRLAAAEVRAASLAQNLADIDMEQETEVGADRVHSKHCLFVLLTASHAGRSSGAAGARRM